MQFTFLFFCGRDNLQLNESLATVQLDTYRLHHQTSRCKAERDEKGEKRVDTESIKAEQSVSTDSLHTARITHNSAVHLLQAVAGR